MCVLIIYIYIHQPLLSLLGNCIAAILCFQQTVCWTNMLLNLKPQVNKSVR